uniref:Uncharacterized protein n=1 Tax=Branchiostoma floridae TaxID=7739 RepID=C3YWX8_BRAFL|eukprot:XP_002599360.1 hypothetical protein BRAFLDRAFT_64283 [Branchiostoma floridae]
MADQAVPLIRSSGERTRAEPGFLWALVWLIPSTELSPIVQPGFWESDVTGRTTDSALLSPPSIPRDHPFSEDDSDRCLSELLGTGQNGDQKCQISDACWEMMTSPSYTGYWLTHELFYLEVGERAGCRDQLEVRAAESRKRRGVTGMKSLYCANILREARRIAGDGFLESGQDLFMEQDGCLMHMTGVAAGSLAGYLRYILEYYQDLAEGRL